MYMGFFFVTKPLRLFIIVLNKVRRGSEDCVYNWLHCLLDTFYWLQTHVSSHPLIVFLTLCKVRMCFHNKTVLCIRVTLHHTKKKPHYTTIIFYKT